MLVAGAWWPEPWRLRLQRAVVGVRGARGEPGRRERVVRELVVPVGPHGRAASSPRRLASIWRRQRCASSSHSTSTSASMQLASTSSINGAAAASNHGVATRALAAASVPLAIRLGTQSSRARRRQRASSSLSSLSGSHWLHTAACHGLVHAMAMKATCCEAARALQRCAASHRSGQNRSGSVLCGRRQRASSSLASHNGCQWLHAAARHGLMLAMVEKTTCCELA